MCMQVELPCHVQPFLCSDCGRCFTYRHNLLKHRECHVKPEKKTELWFGLGERGLVLESVCEMEPITVVQQRHGVCMQVELPCHVQPFLCSDCGRCFTYRHNLLKHRECHVKPEKRSDSYRRKVQAAIAEGKPHFKCDTCGKVGGGGGGGGGEGRVCQGWDGGGGDSDSGKEGVHHVRLSVSVGDRERERQRERESVCVREREGGGGGGRETETETDRQTETERERGGGGGERQTDRQRQTDRD